MLSFVLGHSGSGKTEWIYQDIRKKLALGKQVLLLVPEHQILLAEDELSQRCEGIPTLRLEVLSFRRLANRVFRTVGGLSYHYAERGAQLLILWRGLLEASPFLQEYDAVPLTEQGFLEMLLQMISECKRCCITPQALSAIAEQTGQQALQKKLLDLSLIYSTYENLLHKEYDDPADDLTRLHEHLQKSSLFTDTVVYLDSFHGFSYQEQQIISDLLRQAQQVFVALPMLPKERDFHYAEIRDTFLTLQRMANRLSIEITPFVICEELWRFENRDLPYLADCLWTPNEQGAARTQSIDGGICCYEAKDLFEEAEFVAQQIKKEVRNGTRYREIVVMARNLSRYDGVLESVFEAYQIPFFLSKKEQLRQMPLLRFIESALEIVISNYRFQDVMAFLKSGYVDVPLEECTNLEHYLITWGIDGRRFSDDIPWNMNPNGYSDVLASDMTQRLIALNDLRFRIVAMLSPLASVLLQRPTVKEATQALYQFLQSMGVPERLRQENASQSNLIWNQCLHCMDQLVQVVGDLQIETPRHFAQMLRLVVSQQTLRDIPAVVDSVVIGDMAQLRVSQVKSAYILGANEDHFPASGMPQSLLSDSERKVIKQCGLPLPLLNEFASAREFYYVYRAMTLPSKHLTLSYYVQGGARPSTLLKRITQVFSDTVVWNSQTICADDRIAEKETAFSFFCRDRQSLISKALARIYLQEENYRLRYFRLQRSLQTRSKPLSAQMSKTLYQKKMMLSQTRLEKFLECPFAYHCKYTLRLEEAPSKDFRAVDIGNFVHRILERSMQYFFANGKPSEMPADDEIKSLLSQYIKEYLHAACGSETVATVRMQNLFRRLERTSFLLLKNLLQEFLQSEFSPVLFELPMRENQTEDAAKTLQIPLEDKTVVGLLGQIDRVDVCRKGTQLYLRVVDYKTGKKEFKLENVLRGYQLQMLIYLFSLWKEPPEILKQKCQMQATDEVLPAGVLYFNARLPKLKSEVGKRSEGQMEEDLLINRSGILLNDKDVLLAMEHDLGGRYIPITSRSTKPPVLTLEGFGELYEKISKLISLIATEMKQGSTQARPHNPNASCDHCPYAFICRKGIKKSKF